MSASKYYTINQLENAALLPSSNAAAMALAQKLAGSQSKYYVQAQHLLSTWGINNVRIYSASGLRDGDLGSFNKKHVNDWMENTLSAKEVAIVAHHLVAKYPNILKITSKSSSSFPSIYGGNLQLRSTNKLLHNSPFNFKGLKTGTTAQNGINFVGYATLKGEPVISVVLNTPIWQNFNATTALLNQANAKTKLISLKDSPSAKINSTNGKKTVIKMKPQKTYHLFTPRKGKFKIKRTIKLNKYVKAPIKKNQIVAVENITTAGQSSKNFITSGLLINYLSTTAIK